MGIDLDPARNEAAVGLDRPAAIERDEAKAAVLVIPTDEELMIARDTAALVGG
ncbi:MAG: hypothetical protein ACE5R4_11995 [Armatimonadota bacterium]